MTQSWRLRNPTLSPRQRVNGPASAEASPRVDEAATPATAPASVPGLPSSSFRFGSENTATTGAISSGPAAVSISDLPAPLQKLATELDALWGNGDGEVSVAELDRVAKYVLAALPFFTKEATAILELADALGFTQAPETATTLNSIRDGLGELDASDIADGAHYRSYLDEAIATSDKSGDPDLIRSFAAHNPRFHRLSILEHTAAAVLSIRTLANDAGVDWKEAGAVMLLHDIGKILSRNKSAPWTVVHNNDKNWNFSGHEESGARWLKARGLRADLVHHVRTHGDLRRMGPRSFKTLLQRDPRELKEFFLVSLADLLAKGNSPSLVASARRTKPRFEKLAVAAGLDFKKMWGAYEAHRSQWFGTR